MATYCHWMVLLTTVSNTLLYSLKQWLAVLAAVLVTWDMKGTWQNITAAVLSRICCSSGDVLSSRVVSYFLKRLVDFLSMVSLTSAELGTPTPAEIPSLAFQGYGKFQERCITMRRILFVPAECTQRYSWGTTTLCKCISHYCCKGMEVTMKEKFAISWCKNRIEIHDLVMAVALKLKCCFYVHRFLLACFWFLFGGDGMVPYWVFNVNPKSQWNHCILFQNEAGCHGWLFVQFVIGQNRTLECSMPLNTPAGSLVDI